MWWQTILELPRYEGELEGPDCILNAQKDLLLDKVEQCGGMSVDFVGTAKLDGRSDLPKFLGVYEWLCDDGFHRTLQEFVPSRLRVGKFFEHDGQKFIVVVSGQITGDKESPTLYVWAAMPVQAYVAMR